MEEQSLKDDPVDFLALSGKTLDNFNNFNNIYGFPPKRKMWNKNKRLCGRIMDFIMVLRGYTEDDGDLKLMDGTNASQHPLEVVFWHNGEYKPIRFLQKPIGLSWKLEKPITIAKVKAGSHAEQLGIKVGWQIKSIGGLDVGGRSYRYTSMWLAQSLECLPWVQPGTSSISKEEEQVEERHAVEDNEPIQVEEEKPITGKVVGAEKIGSEPQEQEETRLPVRDLGN